MSRHRVGGAVQAAAATAVMVAAMAVAVVLLLMVPMGGIAFAAEQGESLSEDAAEQGEPSSEDAAEPIQTPAVTCGYKQASCTWATVQGGASAGKAGSGRALVKLSLKLEDGAEGGISYTCYSKSAGSSAGADGAKVGTGRASTGIQWIKVTLTGAVAEDFDVYYRAYVKGLGWMGWAKNGQAAGVSKGHWRFVQSYQVRLVAKDQPGPTSSSARYVARKTKAELLSTVNGLKGGKTLRVFGSNYKTSSKAMRKLRSAIRTVGSSKVSFVMIDLTTGEGVSYDPRRTLFSASCLKAAYVAAICQYRPKTAVRHKAEMKKIIQKSSNRLYRKLFKKYGKKPFSLVIRDAGTTGKMGLEKYEMVPTYCLSELWINTYWYFYRDTNKNSTWCRRLYTKSKDSFIRMALGDSARTYTKDGAIGGRYSVQNDSGIVVSDGKPYLITVMSKTHKDPNRMEKLQKLVKALDAMHRDMA